jgi:Spy/CpxP family protein refolding chaperone
MTRLVRIATVVTLAAASAALAQPMHGGRGGRGGPPFVDRMYPPGLVMRHQEAVGLTEAQRATIKQSMADTERALVDLRWGLEAEMEKLTKLLDAATVDEEAALAQAERVMQAEQRLKKAHLTLLIRIKNALTPPQREKLDALRGRDPGPPGPPPD